MTERTQVGIVGAGPAGLVLAHLLRQHGIASIVIENRTRAYCESRVRAGLLEQGSVDLIDAIDAGERLHREGLVHHGIFLRFAGRSHHVDFASLTGGKAVTIYGQQEAVKDLIALHYARGGDIRFEVEETAVEDLTSDHPRITYRDATGEHEIVCDYIAGCDGFHGVCRPSVPAGALTFYDREYPFGWLGILAESPPLEDELVYCFHERGFALFTMRSKTVSRSYLQVPFDEQIDGWSDERIWAEFHERLGGDDRHQLVEGPILQKGVTPMRSFVTVPMRYGRLFFAGDSAHIVPPTGAKGMNLALSDVAVLARAFAEAYGGDGTLLERYSEIALRRVWKAERFSWWMTQLLHVFDDRPLFDQQMQLAELDYVTSSRAGAETLAEQYVGLPILFD